MLKPFTELAFLHKTTFAHYLKCLLTSMVSNKVINAGIPIIKENRVMVITKNPPKWQLAVLKSKGAKKGFGVVLDQLGTDNPRLTCNCRKGYEEHGPCEHVAAGLLFLIHQEHLHGLKQKPSGLLHSSRLPYFLEVPNRISDVIQQHAPELTHFYHEPDELVTFEDWKAKPLKATVWTEIQPRMMNKQEVIIGREGKLVYTLCNCNEQVTRMCKHQIRALGQIMVKDDFFFQYWLDEYKKEQEKQQPPKTNEPLKWVEPEKVGKLLFLSELDGFIMFKPLVQYNDVDADPLSNDEPVWANEETKTAFYRDEKLESEYLQWLISLHPDFEKQKHGSLFFLPPEKIIAKEWFFHFLEALEKEKVEVLGQKDLKSFKYSFSKPEANFQLQSGINWFDARIEISFNGELVPIEKLRRAIINKQEYVVLGDGSLGILPQEWIKKLERYFRIGQKNEHGGLRVAKQHFSALDDLMDDINDQALQQEIADKKKALADFTEFDDVVVPKSVFATLRPYQLEGLKWLQFLHKYGFGGILADDMGLGKTLQTIAQLAYVIEQNKSQIHLVVAPTSLLHNWQNEIKKFCPSIDAIIHHGQGRGQNAESFANHQLIITTYGTLVNDIEWLKDLQFGYLVMDESQAIKNLQSQRNKALRLIVAEHKLALSGTPVENHTFELYAQMQVINPAFLGMAEHFKREYAKPIDQDGDQEKAEELRKMVKPFILRRTKQQVAKDLPEKLESVLYCDMGPEQRTIYEKIKAEARDEVLGDIDENGVEKSQFHVLTALLKLRQLCLSTGIVKLDEYHGTYSAKLDVLKNQLAQLPKGSKALVFSQFVKMLDQVKNLLDDTEMPYAYLDGQTRDRQAVVDQFQENEECKVFVISLKAGGTGLNLTAADYVYILDPWWNPAVEAQAIDRAYRIGQKKRVFAYKLICENTIEEKILKLQQKKLAVAEGVVQTEEGMLKQMSKEDIAELFG
ncbi:MAG: DEAD/DEAH box helicase [Bacteroidetes bacterium]|nr:DEAD/DEAH box helicase [Bacteroidota bacterium]